MRRECMDCQAHMGEKCPKCGTSNVTFHRSYEDGSEVKIFTCLNSCCPALDGHIRYQFREGEGGTTSGLCQGCLQTRNRQEARA